MSEKKSESGNQEAPRSRRARLHALLFAGAALGPAILIALSESKLPPYQGE